jgi:hypothetical protein
MYSGEFQKLISLFENSVIEGLAVSAPGGMNVRVASGFAVHAFGMYSSYTNEDLAIAANSSGNPRYDGIYLEFANGSATPPWRFRAVVVQGTPAASPVVPAFATANAEGVLIASVLVNHAASSIVTGNITDLRSFYTPAIADASITLAKLAPDVTDLIDTAYGSVHDSNVSETDATYSDLVAHPLVTCTLPALPVGVSYKVIAEGVVQAEGISALCDGTITLALTGQSSVVSGTNRWEHGVDAPGLHFAEWNLTGDGVAKTATLSVTRSSGGSLTVRRSLVKVEANPN